jgi:hypothetical protein
MLPSGKPVRASRRGETIHTCNVHDSDIEAS